MRVASLAAAVAAVAASAACGASASDGGGGAARTTIKLLVDNSEATVKGAQAVTKAFEAANPDVEVQIETRPQGGEGDNVVKTKLSTGEMADVFWYNSGSLLQALNPAQTLVELTGDPALKDVDPSFLPVVTQGGKVYAAPSGTAMGGGVLYNKAVYARLGLRVPKTWAEFVANCEKVKAAGLVPVISTFKDTWTSQLLVLGDYRNVALADPGFAEKYTANKAKFATEPAAVRGFEHLAEMRARGYLNRGYGSATLAQGLKLLADGKGVHYPMLTFVVGQISDEQNMDVGFFGIPGDDASKAGATLWMPGGQYIPRTSKHVAAAKRFIAFVASPTGSAAYSSAVPPTGPYLVKGAALPPEAPVVAQDLQAYIDAGAVTPALEFLSPIKGPALEQITVAVGTGQTTPQDGAAQYDKDVAKQAEQLGVPGW